MKWIRVYNGTGMYEEDTAILMRVLRQHVDETIYNVGTITPDEIVNDTLTTQTTVLLAIGGGYDLGLIQALGHRGMNNIQEYVRAGGSYLGICSGAYFACDRIEFDKDGPLEVVGERFLKFYPDAMIGPLYKPYNYKNRSGASLAQINFAEELPHRPETMAVLPDTDIFSLNRMNHCSHVVPRSTTCESHPHCHEFHSECDKSQPNCVSSQQQCNEFQHHDKSQLISGCKTSYQPHLDESQPHLDKCHTSRRPHLNESQSHHDKSHTTHQPGLDESQSYFDKCHASRQPHLDESQSHLDKSHTSHQLHLDESRSHLGKCHTSHQLPPDEPQPHLDKCHTSQHVVTEQSKKPSDESTNRSLNRQPPFCCKVFFNGGGYFQEPTDGHISPDQIQVLSRYLDLPGHPAAIVLCKFGNGTAVLSGAHLEYHSQDIDDGDTTVADFLPILDQYACGREHMMKSILHLLNVGTKKDTHCYST